LARDGLIDEYRIGVVSLLLGKGTPLFERLANRVPLRLVETRPLGDKIVLLRFLPDGSKP
jgi:dihydrofolate reductase